MTTHSEGPVPALTREDIKTMAAQIARDLQAASGTAPNEAVTVTGGGSQHRALPEDLRRRFIEIRMALFQRGIYDPVLVRFDTATVTQASTQQIAEQLAAVAESL